MAQLISVKLSRFDGSPWGFRLQGGKDFGTPLIVQKVNNGSPAEAAGLKAGDAVIKVNNTEMYNLRHKDAQDVIVKAGNNFELTVQRGGSTWKPHVTSATANLPPPVHTASAGNIAPVTKTSLAAKKQDGSLVGSGHNFSPKPFLNGTDGSIKSIVNKQYNSPVGIYSEETIAETLSAQAEVLAGGVLGVNFKKNEKNYNAENSEVFKMVQEADKEPKTPEPAEPSTGSGVITPSSPALAGLRPVQAPETKPQPSTPQTSLPPGQNICVECERLIVTEYYSSVSHAVGGRATSPRSPTPLFHAMGGSGSAPAGSRSFVWTDESRNQTSQQQKQESSAGSGSSTPSGIVCSNCDRVIVGVFVRIKEKNLHVECFKCSTCGTSLKNVGYYNINNKLYCDIHAKLVARQNAPADLVPITVPPGGKAPASTISAALANAPLSPPLSNHGSSPQPFSTSTSNSLIGPKPFGGSSGFSSNVPSTPTINSSGILSRPQSQTVTETCSNETYERSCYYEIVEGSKDQLSHSSSVKSSQSFVWPPPIEDITYPTASPLYINPNPVLDKSNQAIREKRASIKICEQALANRIEEQGESIDREVKKASKKYNRREVDMDRVSCPEQPAYRRIELMDISRSSRSDVTTSRASSTDSARRSLTPTRIIQPIPKPWTATVSSSRTNLYEQSYARQQEQPSAQVCKKFVQREVCHREHISGVKDHREEQRAYKAEICQKETICPKPPLPMSNQEPTDVVKEVDIEVTDLRDNKMEEMEVSQEIRGKCDFITDIAEETVDGMHVKQSAIFEKTIEKMASQERSRTPMIEEEEDQTESERLTKRIETHINREVQDTKKKRKIEEQTVEKSSETIMSAIDVQQILEKTKQEEEEEREREEKEEQKKKEKEEKKKCEEEERRREEEEKGKKHVTFEDNEEVEEVLEQPLGRTVVREERITESDGSVPGRTKITKETYEEITEEVLVQERIRRKNAIDEERKKSLREQVKVHQSLRDQQAIDKHGVIIKYNQQPQETMETCKKRVQFLKETETGPKPLSDISVKNSTPKEWKSEMVNALTTVPDQPYATLNATSSVKELYTEETIYLDHKCRPKPPPAKEEIRSISPFQQALTIAPERSYTLLNREIRPEDQQIASRSQTPSLQVQNESYCPPLDILYGKKGTTRESYSQKQLYVKKEIKESGPRPLSTASSYDYRLRDSAASPARSRLETSKLSKSLTTSLKKPDTIPSYQKNLVTMKKEPVESQPFIPSRTPTPTTGRFKSPVQELPKLRSSKRDSVHFPSNKIISYHVEEDTDTGHRTQEYSASRTVNYDEKEISSLDKSPSNSLYAQFQETRCMTSEESNEQQNATSHVKKALQVVENYEKCEQREKMSSTPQSLNPITCDISNAIRSKSALTNPMNSQASPAPSRQSIYSSSMDVRHMRYETPSPKICPETGVTILPCKAHFNQGAKTGVVVVPCEGSQTTCSRSGVCVTPTQDRSGVCAGVGGLSSAGSKSGSFAGSSAPKRGRGILNQAVRAGSRIPLCAHCNSYVRGPFITALGQIWCPDHFVCVNAQCRRPLQDIGFVEEKGQLYCEYCFEKYIAPTCNKCNNKIKGDCLNAIGKHFHPECFNCAYCGKLFGNTPFFLEEGLPYCEADWNELFTTKCFACGFPVEAGDRWVEALNNNYHSQCFNCTMCKKNLEGQSFYAKGGRPFCKNHAR
ncbi:PDZ and LIM domain protein Zasp isoform X5 [Pseudomyrmex gracilis]|uniref:PDZ and LIM domain protein Zasp isoform X5 n=1 Tax=Pseudomyrmex gracilis TaxID=219809 RepID=UPI000995926A|nr:PDZ and LIM domain protein Zasp isoform X5 [Pseudomyrmex gracilis]